MSDFTRLLEDGELGDDVRQVLTAGLNAPVPPDAEGAVWGAVMKKLPLAAVAGGAGMTATPSLAAMSLVKIGLAGAALGTVTTLALVGGQRLLESPGRATAVQTRPAPRAAEPVAPSRTSEGPIALHPTPELPHSSAPLMRARGPRLMVPEPAGIVPSVAAPEGTAPSSAAPAATAADFADRVALESSRVADARARLAAGDARGALTVLKALDRDFPNGVLGQERDALAIESFVVLGERAKARALATEFLARYPRSAHATAVERAMH